MISILSKIESVSDAMETMQFISELIKYDPNVRATARTSLRHAYFQKSPLPTDTSMMPVISLD